MANSHFSKGGSAKNAGLSCRTGKAKGTEWRHLRYNALRSGTANLQENPWAA